MAPEKMSLEKMAPGKKGIRKKWHYVNLKKMAPYLFYGLLQSMGKLIATCHKTSHTGVYVWIFFYCNLFQTYPIVIKNNLWLNVLQLVLYINNPALWTCYSFY